MAYIDKNSQFPTLKTFTTSWSGPSTIDANPVPNSQIQISTSTTDNTKWTAVWTTVGLGIFRKDSNNSSALLYPSTGSSTPWLPSNFVISQEMPIIWHGSNLGHGVTATPPP